MDKICKDISGLCKFSPFFKHSNINLLHVQINNQRVEYKNALPNDNLRTVEHKEKIKIL